MSERRTRLLEKLGLPAAKARNRRASRRCDAARVELRAANKEFTESLASCLRIAEEAEALEAVQRAGGDAAG